MHSEITSEKSVPFLWLAWTIPPTATGMSVVTRNLLRWFRPDECVMIGQVIYAGRSTMEGIEHHPRIEIPSHAIHWRLKPYLEPFYLIPMLVNAGCKAVKQHRLRAVVALYPNASFLCAGYLIARLMHIPFFPYFHNLYVETRTNRVAQWFARRLQRFLFSRAARIFSMSEGMTDFFTARYGVRSLPLLHAINCPIPVPSSLPKPEKPFRIAFSGNINFTMIEPLQKVILAIGEDPEYEIVLHTPVKPDDVRKRVGAWARNITLKDAPTQEELVASLRGCDLFVLALADMRGRELEDDFRTQFPTRTLEMLVAQRPILLLCPKEYFLARFFVKWGCGEVLESTDPHEIREAIERLCTDEEQRRRYVEKALAVATLYRGERVSGVLRDELYAAVNRKV